MLKTKIAIGDMVDGEVFKVTNFGAFVKLEDGQRGLIHISQIADNFVKDINSHLKLGDRVKARVLNIIDNKIDLTLKKPKEEASSRVKNRGFRSSVFEDKLKLFLEENKGDAQSSKVDLSRGGAVR